MSEEIETGVSHIAYFRTDSGSSKLYTQEYVDDLQNQLQQKDKEIERLNKENKILRKNAEHNDKVVDKVNWENKRLNNIINELEKYINETKLEEFEKVYGRSYGKTFTQAEVIICNMILNKLQELKGSDK